MTPEEFYTQYPYATRRACGIAIKEQRINGWAASGRLGKEERFQIHVIVAKPVPVKLKGAKRITARSICADIWAKLEADEGEVDRAEFIAKAMGKGVSRPTATTRYADLAAGRE